MRRVLATLAVGLLSYGCYLSGSSSGGTARFDASVPEAAVFDAGAIDASACDGVEAGVPTWTALYADTFGPTGRASCTANKGGCHAAPTEPGSAITGYVCPPDKDQCWQGITSASAMSENGAPLVVRGDAGASYLPQILRKVGDPSNVLRMPLAPSDVTFCPTEIDRVRAWIDHGAKND